MGRYIVQRLIQGIIMLAALSVVFFLLQHHNPRSICGFGDAECAARMGLSRPISDQYLLWLRNLTHGDFGTSADGEAVGTILLQKLPATLLLVGVSFMVQQALAIPLGILAAVRQYSRFDVVLSGLAYIALSTPGFVLGLLLLYVFCVRFHMLPVGHYESVEYPLLWSGDWFTQLHTDPWPLLADLAWHLILPAFVLTLTGIAVDSRFMRASMLQVLHQEYIRTAHAKGLTRRRVIFKHAFRNALPPVITNMALYLPTLAGSVIIVEQVFTWGGLGYAFAGAVTGADFAVAQAIFLLTSLVVLLANLCADLAYVWLDPRIRYE